MYKEIFKSRIANYLNVNLQNVFFFWKGRVGLYAILKAIRIKEGDEIILPAFTCVVAVNPIIYLGAKPVYVDIDPKTYNMDINKIEEKITKRTKVILAQNTFGLAPDLDKIFEIANKYRLIVIEDCAHGFGGKYKGKLNGTVADVSFFSTQWNKPFSTGIGGIVVTKNLEIGGNLKKIEEKAVEPSLKDQLILKLLMYIKDYFLNSKTYWFGIKMYRWMSKYNLVLGSSQGYELEKPVMPKNFLKVFSEIQAKRGIKELKNINEIINHRKEIASSYKKILTNLDIEPPYEPDYATHTYLKYPILVKDRKRFLKDSEKNKIEIGDWFLSPIHPITKNFELWEYKWGENPISEKISQHIVNLPTHLEIDENYLEKIKKFLIKNRKNIFSSYKDCLSEL